MTITTTTLTRAAGIAAAGFTSRESLDRQR